MENKDLDISIKQFHFDLTKSDEIAKLTEMCRVCLCETKEESYQLQDTMIFFNERHKVKNMLEESTGIQITNLDTLPNRICFRCLKSLKSWHKFRSQCQRSDDVLQKLNSAEDKKSISIADLTDSLQVKNIQVSSDKPKRKPRAVKFVLNCDCCDMTFISQKDLDKHKEAKTINAEPNNSKIFQCDMCSKSFLFEFGLSNHKELSHYFYQNRPIYVSKSTFDCTNCGKSFSKLDFLKKHNRWPCVSLKLIELCKVPPLMVPMEELIAAWERIVETTNISCVFCKKDFKNEYELNPHVSTIHKGINRTCNICKKDLKTVKLLEMHMRKHLHAKNYSCPICARSFYAIIPFRSHIIDHSRKELVYRCNVCQKEYLIEHEFVSHMKTHLLAERNDKKSSEQEEEENDALEIENDGKTESDNENESITSEEDNSENKPSVKMETDLDTYSINGQQANKILKSEKGDSECSASIKMETDSPVGNMDSKVQLEEKKLHSTKTVDLDAADGELYDSFVKPELNISADEKSDDDTEYVSTPTESNNSHVEQDELDNLRKIQKIYDEIQFTCHIEKCEANISGYYYIMEHFASEHLSDDLPFECSVCLEQFQTKKSILSHIKKYYVIKCPVCSKSIKNITDMRKHISRMHCNDGTSKFECPKCNKKYRGRNDLRIHLITHSKKKNFSCDSCPKTFFSYNGLYLHAKSHKVIKELQCQICGIQAPSKYKLRLHTKVCLSRKELEMK